MSLWQSFTSEYRISTRLILDIQISLKKSFFALNLNVTLADFHNWISNINQIDIGYWISNIHQIDIGYSNFSKILFPSLNLKSPPYWYWILNVEYPPDWYWILNIEYPPDWYWIFKIFLKISFLALNLNVTLADFHIWISNIHQIDIGYWISNIHQIDIGYSKFL